MGLRALAYLEVPKATKPERIQSLPDFGVSSHTLVDIATVANFFH